MADLVPETTSWLNGHWRSSFNQLQIITIPITIVLCLPPELTSLHSMIAFTIPTLLSFLQILAALRAQRASFLSFSYPPRPNELHYFPSTPDFVPETTSSLNRHWRSSISFQINQLQIHIPITIVLCVDPELTFLYSMIAFTIPTLLAFLYILAAAQAASLFQIRPVTTMASVFAVSGYYALSLAWRYLPTYGPQLRKVMLHLGSLAVASLTSLLLPPSLWGLLFVFYFLLVVLELLPFIKNIYYNQ